MTDVLDNHAYSVPILMYHSVSNDASPAFEPFSVVPSEFEDQLCYLRSEGYRSYTISEFLAAAAADQLAPRPVVLTFDDGFVDFADCVCPLLFDHAFTATLYVVSDLVGSHSSWLEDIGESNRPLLNWSQLKCITASGIEIGSHSRSHPALDRVPLAQALREISGSKRAIEDRLGKAVNSFAYPYGYYSRSVRDLVEKAGYTSACAVNYAASTTGEDPFLLSRQIVRRGTDVAQFARILDGRVPLLQLLRDRVRTRAWRALRHLAARIEDGSAAQ